MTEYVVSGNVAVQSWVEANTAAEALDKFRDLVEYSSADWSRDVDVVNVGSLSATKLED